MMDNGNEDVHQPENHPVGDGRDGNGDPNNPRQQQTAGSTSVMLLAPRHDTVIGNGIGAQGEQALQINHIQVFSCVPVSITRCHSGEQRWEAGCAATTLTMSKCAASPFPPSQGAADFQSLPMLIRYYI